MRCTSQNGIDTKTFPQCVPVDAAHDAEEVTAANEKSSLLVWSSMTEHSSIDADILGYYAHGHTYHESSAPERDGKGSRRVGRPAFAHRCTHPGGAGRGRC